MTGRTKDDPPHDRAGHRALPRSAQYIEIDGEETRVCGGGFGIFGHGNVPCLGEALYPVRGDLPLYRGQNEQSMGFAAAAYAKHQLRQRFMFCTAVAGPGTANLLTAAALAHANRLPVLLLCGDTFVTRLPDPVLQQTGALRRPDLRRERRVQAGDPVSGTGSPIPRRSCSRCPMAHGDDARPRRLRPGLHRPAAGRAGLGLRLPGSVLREDGAPHPPARRPDAAEIADAVGAAARPPGGR